MKNKVQSGDHKNLDIHIKNRPESEKKSSLESGDLRIAAIVPLRGHTKDSIDHNETLIRKCIDSLKESRHINHIVVSADDEKLLQKTERYTQIIPIMRPKKLSNEGVRVHEVLKYTIDALEKSHFMPDIVVPVEITYPFRPPALFDHLIEMMLDGGYDTVIAGVPEYRVCWRETESGFEAITDLGVSRAERSPLYIGLPSLGCVIEPDLVKSGRRYGENLGIFQVDEPFATVEIRNPDQLHHIAKQLYWPV